MRAQPLGRVFRLRLQVSALAASLTSAVTFSTSPDPRHSSGSPEGGKPRLSGPVVVDSSDLLAGIAKVLGGI